MIFHEDELACGLCLLGPLPPHIVSHTVAKSSENLNQLDFMNVIFLKFTIFTKHVLEYMLKDIVS